MAEYIVAKGSLLVSDSETKVTREYKLGSKVEIEDNERAERLLKRGVLTRLGQEDKTEEKSETPVAPVAPAKRGRGTAPAE